jgi:hypothetical protein
MLSGRTPFSGDMQSVMRQHVEEPPPPLKQKLAAKVKIPKKVARLVMSTLAKNPDERPASAAGFATALRANSEGAGALLRRSLTLYSEHLPIFFRASFITLSPSLLLIFLQFIGRVLWMLKIVSPTVGMGLTLTLVILNILAQLFTNSVNMGVTTHLVTQLVVAPLRPIRMRAAFELLRARFRPFMSATALVTMMSFFGIMLGFIPGLIVMTNYLLVAPVVLMEDKRGRAARARSKELSKRSRRTVWAIVFVIMIVPFIAAPLLSFLIAGAVRMLKLPEPLHMTSIIHLVIWTPIYFVIVSLSAVITALLYLKTRQAGGETLREALARFDLDEVPRSKWQQRMRERSSVYTQSSR